MYTMQEESARSFRHFEAAPLLPPSEAALHPQLHPPPWVAGQGPSHGDAGAGPPVPGRAAPATTANRSSA